MTMGRTTPRPRHGPAGLLMALFVVAGLVFSYGLGHGPPREVCTAHLVHVPAGVAAATPDAGAASPSSTAAPAYSAPVDLPPLSPMDATCLCMAVLAGLLVLALAAKPRRSGRSLPRRTGWFLPPPVRAALLSPSLASLQVLRL
ncbi:hypothetical protein [Spirillospora sp. NPDC029432]|uniref:hypothetical protein n=1 Tax=Spirillospora sp. NPDC029432 TaxID=3154599 RepID=UPI003454E782